MFHRGRAGNMGIRNSYSDIGQTIAKHLNLPPLEVGISAIDSAPQPF